MVKLLTFQDAKLAEVNETPSDFKPKTKAPSVDGSEIRLTS